MLAYAAILAPTKKAGGSSCPSATCRKRSPRLDEALCIAADALTVALDGYVEAGWAFPKPSPTRAGEHLVILPALVAPKLELYRRMCETGTTRVALAQMLGTDERAERRLLAYKHRSHIGQIEAALAKLGKRLEVTVRDAA